MNGSIFTFDQTTNVFTTNTDDVNFASIVNLKITAWIGNGLSVYDTKKEEHPFAMDLNDWCDTAPALVANPGVTSYDYTY